MYRQEITNLLKPNSICIELGVAAGSFSDDILKSKNVSMLYSIDSWCSGGHHTREYISVINRLSKYRQRNTIIRSTFDECLFNFEDGFFDFIYIDGYAHTGQENGKTLYDWWPKLKKGGIFAGHDYSDSWPLTKKSVDSFALKYNRELTIISGNIKLGGEEQFDSWLLTK